ncbi:MAG TPA: FAD-dependent oxidoreductase [Steroidobacteraceae bacterium]|nr:FAD-dependent oxidoreductase [Steroidobacteraceae bacterium]
MKSHARVVVIGGGIVGCSVLYHLAKAGWTEVVLCERKELTAGSSWHAAGAFHALNSDGAMSRLQAYTVGLYPELERISGQDIGLHYPGGLNVAATRERWDLLRADVARHRTLGLDTRLVGPAEIQELCPIMDVKGVYGAIYDPMEGHLDPSGATQAFAKAARQLGAEIHRHTRVVDLRATGRGGWLVVTERGNIEAEHVVNAAGLWAREVGQLAGVELPLVPMEHHYLITEDLPELGRQARELPVVVDLDGEMYMRQERRGVLLGVYETPATPWAVRGTPWEYGDNELLAPALERLTAALEKGFTRFPTLNAAGIRRIVNGPFTFTPDGNPLVGPVPGVANYWAACGVMAGFCQGGGVGRVLAQWLTTGEPDGDAFALDVARFGPHATRAYVLDKAGEFYSRRFRIAYPNEYWPAGRPSKTSALYGRLVARNAVHGVSYGLEYPLYFAPAGEPAAEVPSLRRSNAFAPVGAECRAARSTAGVLDASSFSKYEFAGPGAEAALDRLMAGRLPAPGRARLTPMLAPSGRLMGDLTTIRLADDRFLVMGSGYLQAWHLRWFHAHLPPTGVTLRNLSDDWGGLAIFGPRSREALARVTAEDVGPDALPFMAARLMDVGLCQALVARLSVTGELGYEIHAPQVYLGGLYDRLMAASRELGVVDVGMYALLSLRIEKGFGIWTREFSRDYTPEESGLARFVAYDKPGFVGREAALRDRDAPPRRRLVLLEVAAGDADASFYEPVWAGEEHVGFVTSAAYGHTCGRSLALGYVRSDAAGAGTALAVTIVGERRDCVVLGEPPVDPGGARMRG